jgi:hypothetical protein
MMHNNILKTGDQSPGKRKEHVRHIVRLSNDAEPPIDENTVSGLGLQSTRVLDNLPRQLRKRVALGELSLALHLAEAILLAVGGIPHPVHEEVNNDQGSQGIAVPSVLGGVVVGKVDGAVAVAERYAGHVPECEQEAKLLKVHVPIYDQSGAAGYLMGSNIPA